MLVIRIEDVFFPVLARADPLENWWARAIRALGSLDRQGNASAEGR